MGRRLDMHFFAHFCSGKIPLALPVVMLYVLWDGDGCSEVRGNLKLRVLETPGNTPAHCSVACRMDLVRSKLKSCYCYYYYYDYYYYYY